MENIGFVFAQLTERVEHAAVRGLTLVFSLMLQHLDSQVVYGKVQMVKSFVVMLQQTTRLKWIRFSFNIGKKVVIGNQLQLSRFFQDAHQRTSLGKRSGGLGKRLTG